VYAQTIGVIAYSVYAHNIFIYIIGILFMGRAHTQNGELMHNAMHRSLFSNKKINDFVGRWMLAYPSAIMFDRFKYYHLVHHANELGEKEPETPIYANYPITRLSLCRKLFRDMSGFIGAKNLYYIYVVSPRYRAEDRVYRRKVLFVQILILLAFTFTVGAQFYLLLWVIPWLTSRRVIERLYAITEHGGMMPSNDVRLTTHFVRQTFIAKFLFMPLNRGHHMAHHIDPRISFRYLPKVTKEMRSSGFIPDTLVHKNYTTLIKKLSYPKNVRYSEVRIPTNG
jgi:fatty acid desaturase